MRQARSRVVRALNWWVATCNPIVNPAVRKLPEVEEAKSLMLEAMEWSVFTWLFEKRRVRETADRANAALDRLNRRVKARWSADVRAAYKELTAKGRATGSHKPEGKASWPINGDVRFFAERVKEADDAAYRARMTAEDTFDEAERRMSTDLACEGCRQAIHSWELHEKAIRRAEGAPEPSATDS